jgi:hypothetical protein
VTESRGFVGPRTKDEQVEYEIFTSAFHRWGRVVFVDPDNGNFTLTGKDDPSIMEKAERDIADYYAARHK